MKALEILKHLTTFCGVGLHNDCVEAIAELEALNQPKSCEWHLGDYDQNSWISKCGAEWILIEDTPLGNGMNFCHKCGGKLIQLETEKDEEDEHE